MSLIKKLEEWCYDFHTTWNKQTLTHLLKQFSFENGLWKTSQFRNFQCSILPLGFIMCIIKPLYFPISSLSPYFPSIPAAEWRVCFFWGYNIYFLLSRMHNIQQKQISVKVKTQHFPQSWLTAFIYLFFVFLCSYCRITRTPALTKVASVLLDFLRFVSLAFLCGSPLLFIFICIFMTSSFLNQSCCFLPE